MPHPVFKPATSWIMSEALPLQLTWLTHVVCLLTFIGLWHCHAVMLVFPPTITLNYLANFIKCGIKFMPLITQKFTRNKNIIRPASFWGGGHTNTSFWILKWCMVIELGKICIFCWGNIFCRMWNNNMAAKQKHSFTFSLMTIINEVLEVGTCKFV